MPRGEKISEVIWTRQGRIRFPPAPVPSLTWAQGRARTWRLPLLLDKHQTLLQGTLRLPLLVVWRLPCLGAGAKTSATCCRALGGWSPKTCGSRAHFGRVVRRPCPTAC